MRIAIPTDDGVTFAGHTGRAAGMAVFEIAEGAAKQIEVRWRDLPQGESCHNHNHGSAEHSCASGGEHQGHSHGEILDQISDCEMMLAIGAGPRLIRDLSMRGVRVKFCSYSSLVEAADMLAKGTLVVAHTSGCDHGGHHG